jgi:Ca2+-binding EF-hand superfamily protein
MKIMHAIVALALAGATPVALAQTAAKGKKESWELLFNKADTNNDHGLSRAEIKAARDKKLFDFSEIDKHFAEMDANKDGKVTIDERYDWGKKNKKTAAKK